MDESLDDCVCVGVNVLELVPDPVNVCVPELLDVFDALAPRETDGDGVAVFEDVIDALAEAVSLDAREKLPCAVDCVVILAAADTVATIEVVEIAVRVVVKLLLPVGLNDAASDIRGLKLDKLEVLCETCTLPVTPPLLDITPVTLPEVDTLPPVKLLDAAGDTLFRGDELFLPLAVALGRVEVLALTEALVTIPMRKTEPS